MRDAFEVAGRGELQLAILIETMRREGFELGVVASASVRVQQGRSTAKRSSRSRKSSSTWMTSTPASLCRKCPSASAEMIDMRPSGGGRTRIVFHAPTRGLIGYHGELLSDTRGTGIMNRLFHAVRARTRARSTAASNGVLISNGAGEAVAYALWNLEDRGPMMIEPGIKVYEGMIIGEHTRDNDLEVNVLEGQEAHQHPRVRQG